MSNLQWANAEKTLIRRDVEAGVQFIPTVTENTVYREEILPLIKAGTPIAPFAPPEAQTEPRWAGFRGAIALLPEYERILNAIAAINPTRQTSVVQAWSKVEDRESLKVAVYFWNEKVVPEAAITEAEAAVIQALANKFDIPVKVSSTGIISIVSSP